MWPAFPTPEYYDPLRLPLGRPPHFPGSPVIGGASLPATPQATGPRRLSRVPTTTIRTFNAQYAGGSISARSWNKNAFRGLRRRPNGSAPSWPPEDGFCLTTLTQASLTLQTARSLRPASHPTSRSRTGASLPGTQASPRTGLAPAGHRELVAPTSCGPPFPHGARAVPAHWAIAQVRALRLRAHVHAAASRAVPMQSPATARCAAPPAHPGWGGYSPPHPPSENRASNESVTPSPGALYGVKCWSSGDAPSSGAKMIQRFDALVIVT